MVHRRAKIPHKAHKEEGHLQDRVLDEPDPVNNVFVPCRALKVGEESCETDEDSDANRLLRSVGHRAVCPRMLRTGIATSKRIASPAATASAACL